MSEHILFAYKIGNQGDVSPLEGQAIADCVKANDLAWVHFDADDERTESWFKSNLTYMDQTIIDALLAENTRPRAEEIENGLLVILRGVNLNENADPEDMVSLRLWVDAHRIISIQKRPLRAVRDLTDRMQRTAMVKNSGDLLAQVVSRLFQNMEPFVSDLSIKLDDIEEDLAERSNPELRRDIIDIRKKAILFRRYFAPQKDVMSFIRTCDLDWLDSKHKRLIQENQDRITRYVEDLDAVRERAQIIKDELANSLSEKLNRNLYVLSIITAIFLPLSFLTGLLGINVGGMPGADNDQAF